MAGDDIADTQWRGKQQFERSFVAVGVQGGAGGGCEPVFENEMSNIERDDGSLQPKDLTNVTKTPNPNRNGRDKENPWIKADVTFAAGEP